MKNFLFCLFFGFIFKSNAQEINFDYFNNFRRVSEINDGGDGSNVKNFGNIQARSLSGRYYFTDKFSLGIGLNYSLNKYIDSDLYWDSIERNYLFTNRTKNFQLYFSPTFKLPIKKIKGLGQYSPELFFSYCIGIGNERRERYDYVRAPTGYILKQRPDYQQVTIPSFYQLHASVPLKNSFSLNISLRGAQRDLSNLQYYDLFEIRPVQVGFGIGYKFNSFKSRNTKGTREVI
ncbi:MAG: hypothetical protein FJX80_12145 [Bacteroidetes bacterium]|nr:hypothetical protein [Bacteroidota bacterium]